MKLPNPLKLISEYRGARNDRNALEGDFTLDAEERRAQVQAIISKYHFRVSGVIVLSLAIGLGPRIIREIQKITPEKLARDGETRLKLVPIELSSQLGFIENANFLKNAFETIKIPKTEQSLLVNAMKDSFVTNWPVVRPFLQAAQYMANEAERLGEKYDPENKYAGDLSYFLVTHGKAHVYNRGTNQDNIEEGFMLFFERMDTKQNEDFIVKSLQEPAPVFKDNKERESHAWHVDHKVPYWNETLKTLFVPNFESEEKTLEQKGEKGLYMPQSVGDALFVALHNANESVGMIPRAIEPKAQRDDFLKDILERQDPLYAEIAQSIYGTTLFGKEFQSAQELVDIFDIQIKKYLDKNPLRIKPTTQTRECMIYIAAFLLVQNIHDRLEKDHQIFDAYPTMGTLSGYAEMIVKYPQLITLK